ncbi:primase alpha helix C-terminal domain-containing protein, partial [Streptomyces neyagawaensis]|uniref:primase alpha helix C-terminal domain-containing protein n=1 Tax=Streptomyces neyagawaensis TaxID=42238 RepID=UPI000A71AB13
PTGRASALLRLLLPPPTREPRAGGGAAGRPGGRGLGRGSGFDLGGGIPAADGRGHGEWRGQGHPRGHDHGHGLIHFVLTAHEGQRNTRLFWAACRAYENGLGPDLANALIDAAIHTGLTEREARSTVASAARMSGRRG